MRTREPRLTAADGRVFRPRRLGHRYCHVCALGEELCRRNRRPCLSPEYNCEYFEEEKQCKTRK
ncbi:MAG: hypothetical protein LUC33_05085 [Prevotellaceae bacterium]|nr:hypothetical protein [Prevotellaceae bacterium]